MSKSTRIPIIPVSTSVKELQLFIDAAYAKVGKLKKGNPEAFSTGINYRLFENNKSKFRQ